MDKKQRRLKRQAKQVTKKINQKWIRLFKQYAFKGYVEPEPLIKPFVSPKPTKDPKLTNHERMLERKHQRGEGSLT